MDFVNKNLILLVAEIADFVVQENFQVIFLQCMQKIKSNTMFKSLCTIYSANINMVTQ